MQTDSSADTRTDSTRRDFGRTLLAGAAGAAGLSAQAMKPLPGSPKLAVDHLSESQLTGEYMAFLKVMGVEAMDVGVRVPQGVTYDDILKQGHSFYDQIVRIKRRVEEAGFQLAEVNGPFTNMPQSSAALPGRDGEIKAYQQFLRDLGKAGVKNTTYTWNTMGKGYQTGTATTRGCETRLFELEDSKKVPNLHDRVYSEEEVWGNYEYWIKRVLPVAEDAGVRLQAHPNDPPVNYGGFPRIFNSRKAFRRVLETSGRSPYSGLLFCVGCWSEMYGPDGKGEDIVAAIREFGARYIFDVHYRNVSSNLPNFSEVFLDNGYVNMYRIVRALVEVNYAGPVVPDHLPRCSTVNPERGTYHDAAPEAAAFGYIRAMIQAAETELGRRA